MNTALYDIDAKAPRPGRTQQLQKLFQGLLVDRFGLQFHREMKSLSAYTLTVDKKGSKLIANMSEDDFSGPTLTL